MGVADQGQRQADRGDAYRLLLEGAQMFLASRYREALQMTTEALNIYQSLNDLQGITTATETLAGLFYHLSAYWDTLKYARYSLMIARRIDDREGMSRAYGLMGGAYYGLGNYDRALRLHEKSLALAQEVEDPTCELSAYGNIAMVLTGQGKYLDAVACMQQVSERLDPDQPAHAIFYVRLQSLLGMTYRLIGEHGLADEAFRRALAKAEEAGEPMGVSQALVNLGTGLRLQKKYREAISYLERSAKIKEGLSDIKGLSLVRANLGQCYERLGWDDAALTSYHRALELAHEIGFKEGVWQALGCIGAVNMKLGEYERAQGYLKGALELVNEAAQSFDSAHILQGLAYTSFCMGESERAESLLRECIAISETLRSDLRDEDGFKISIFEMQVDAYRFLQWVLVAQGKTDAALEVAERSRARALADNLGGRLRRPTSAETDTLPPDFIQIREIVMGQATTCVMYSLVTSPEQSFWKESNEVEVFIWVIPPDINKPVEFHRTGLLQLEVGELLDPDDRPPGQASDREALYTSRSKMDWLDADVLSLLYDLLVAPVSSHLPKDAEALVTFIPDQRLFLIPFAALLDGSEQYLIKSHTISVSPSIQTLQMSHQQRGRVASVNHREALVVGNPDMPTVSLRLNELPVKLKPLPYAEHEAREIAGLFGTEALVGPAATKRAVLPLMAQARFIHLATHGVFDNLSNSREPGAIALAADEQDKGLLTASEIAGLELHAELAVLSACNTGQGRMTSEGVIGLSRAFMVAGTPSVIVSLWAIGDAPTASLMAHFYRHYRRPVGIEPPYSIAQALRHAMLDTMKPHPAPTDWAGFLLLGAAR